MVRLPVIAVLSLLACNGGADRRPDRPDPTTGDDDDTPTVDTGSTDTGATDTGTAPNNEIPALDAAVAVIRGTGPGVFMYAWDLVDLTGDDEPDLVATAGVDGQTTTFLFEGPLAGEYTESDAFERVLWGAGGGGVGDANGDGILDLGLMKSGTAITEEFHLYFGPFDPAEHRGGPDAVWRPAVGTPTSAGTLCDANGDGVGDVMIAYNSSIRFSLGPFAPGVIGGEATSVVFDEDDDAVFDPRPYMLCGHDLTGDGAHDLLLVDEIDNAVWLLQDPPWSGWQEIVEVGEQMNIINGGGAMEVVGDLTGDGLPDLFVAEGSNGSLLEGPITAASEPFARFEWWESDASTAPLGDLDGDGYADLAVGLPRYHPDGAVLLFHGPIAAGTYDDEDADLILMGEDGEGTLGLAVFGRSDASTWGASAPNSGENGYMNAGRVYLFDGWPSP